MKKVFLLLLALCFAATSYSGNALYEVLYTVNQQWAANPDGIALLQQHNVKLPQSNEEAIQCHLRFVIETLNARDVANLTEVQRAQRKQLLIALQEYMQAGVFPINRFKPYRVPVFIDDAGTHCAVGYMMMCSGHDNLAQEINSKQRFAYVHEIKVNGVSEWAATHGFTIDELAWIQPAYPASLPIGTMNDGLNGPVNCMVSDAQGQIYAGGKFTQAVNGVPCENIAFWISGFAGWDWVSLNGGVNGEVHTLLLHNNKLYVGGTFTQAGNITVENVAVYDLQSGQWSAMGALDNAVLSIAIYENELYAAGRFTGFVAKWDGASWNTLSPGFLYGNEARTLEVFNNQLIIGGDFELATGALRKNVVGYDGANFSWELTQFGTPTPVNDLLVYKNHLYAACDFIYGTDSCAISVLDNNTWHTILKPNSASFSYLDGVSIRCLSANYQGIVAGGLFSISSGMIYGSQLMFLEDADPSNENAWMQFNAVPITQLDSAVNSIAALGNYYYFGGNFVVNNVQTVNHVATFYFNPSSIEKLNNTSILYCYPNPASSFIQIASKEPLDEVSIYSVYGQLILNETNPSTRKINIATLTPGFYILSAKVKGISSECSFVVMH